MLWLIHYQDSSLESMFRKQEKGWARTGGVVKEDSKCTQWYHSAQLLTVKGVIHSIHYHRLVLDEAHSIKVSTSRRLPLLSFSLTLYTATYDWCCQGLFCPASYVQMVSVWYSGTESNRRVFFPASFPSSPPVCMLFL